MFGLSGSSARGWLWSEGREGLLATAWLISAVGQATAPVLPSPFQCFDNKIEYNGEDGVTGRGTTNNKEYLLKTAGC